MLEFGKSRFSRNEKAVTATAKVEEISKKDMAIIGMALKMPMASTLEEYWNNLKYGQDCVKGLSEDRKKDTTVFLRNMGLEPSLLDKSVAAFLDDIDKFDSGFFKISPNEANLMEPSQRLFLETAWAAMEDAGYGGKCLYGSRTGVFVGYGSDPDYKRLLDLLEPEVIAQGMIGNTRPVIASRLSYLMDFRGPSLIVDTTCSSSLMAIHLAIRSIRSGECEQAIVGAVQIHLIPVRKTKIGIEASDGRAKTFDDSSDGTGTGEGVATILIKPLDRAIRDRDHIYAVIKGSAANHDGASIGMTAPSALAQEDVIVNAWKDASVDPETITFIEAHGTGTKLGDPIEIDGITRAFRRFTNRKSFCAIGAVKTNIGHLDSSAGIAGLIKSVLSLQHGEILPNFDFKRPNRKIPFEETPVYVSSVLSKWETDGFPRRCGVSAFGISGTNLHVVLEQAPERIDVNASTNNSSSQNAHILTLSAKNVEAITHQVRNLLKFISKNEYDIDLRSMCYTMNTGRGHYQHRLAFVFDDLEELAIKLKQLETGGMEVVNDIAGAYYGEYRIVPTQSEITTDTDITRSDLKKISNDANELLKLYTEPMTNDRNNRSILNAFSELYISGAEADFYLLYKNEQPYRMSLPTYPFEAKRHWIEFKNETENAELFGRQYFKSAYLEAFRCTLSPKTHWMLSEHRIMGDCVLVGTTFLEMAIRACKSYINDKSFEIKDVLFMHPLVIKDTEERLVQTVIRKMDNYYEFSVESLPEVGDNSALKGQEQWNKHVEGKIYPEVQPVSVTSRINAEELKHKYKDSFIVPDIEEYNRESVFKFGERWKNISGIYVGESELLSLIKMPAKYLDELQDYIIHPAFMDNAVATMPLMQKIFSAGIYQGDEGIFLPFSYKSIKLFGPFPKEFYSYVRLKGTLQPTSEIAVFDMDFADKDGRVFAQIEEYSLKKSATKRSADMDKLFYEVSWIPYDIIEEKKTEGAITALLFKDKGGYGDALAARLKNAGMHVIEVQKGDYFEKLGDGKYVVGNDIQSFQTLFNVLLTSDKVCTEGNAITDLLKVIHLSPLDVEYDLDTIERLNAAMECSLMELFMTARAMLMENIKCKELVVLTRNAYKVLPDDYIVYPLNAAVVGLVKVIEQEYTGIRTACIDIDDSTTVDEVVDDIGINVPLPFTIAHRNGKRLVEELKWLDLRKVEESPIEIKKNGIYVIAGGTGGIGLAISKAIAEKNNVKIVLINRSELPPKDLRRKLVEDEHNQDERLVKKLKTMAEIEAMGSEIIYYKADIASKNELTEVFEDIHDRLGRVNGIIHSAGIAGDSFLIKKAEQAFRGAIASKIQGTWLLDRLTRQDKLDFFILFSSNNVLMGIPGQSDYTAANAYLNSYATYRSLITGQKSLSINWPAWKETGMAHDHGVKDNGIFKAINTGDAVEVFKHILNKKLENVHIGAMNPGGSVMGKTIEDARILFTKEIKAGLSKAVGTKAVSDENKKIMGAKGYDMSVVLKGKKGKEFSNIEMQIASVWKQVLGFDEINIHDDFFDIGGDSILVTRVHSLLDNLYPGNLSVADLFTQNTIYKIAKHIESTYSEEDENLNDSHDMENLRYKSEQRLDSNVIEQKIIELIEQIEQGQINITEAVSSFISIDTERSA